MTLALDHEQAWEMEPPRPPKKDTRRIRLRKRERAELEELTAKGAASARVFRRARVLILLDAGWAPMDVSGASGASGATVRRVRRRYEERGLDHALYDEPRPGAAPALSPKEEARIVAMVCSDPPEGRARWTVRLITEEATSRRLSTPVSRETIRRLLQRHELKPWREKNVVRSTA